MSTSTLPLTSYLANFVLLCHRSRSILFSVELTIKYKDLLKITTIKPNYSIKILPRNGVMSDKKYKQADLSNYFKSSSSKVTSRKRKHSGSDTEDMSMSYADSLRKSSKHDNNKAPFQRNNSSYSSFSSLPSQFPKLSRSSSTENSTSMTATSGSIQSVSGARHMHHQSFSNPSSSGTAFDHSATTSTSEDSQSANEGASSKVWLQTKHSDSNQSSSEATLDNDNSWYRSSSFDEDIGTNHKSKDKKFSPYSCEQRRKSSSQDSTSSLDDFETKENHQKDKKGNSFKDFDQDDKPNADKVKLKPLENSDDHVVLCDSKGKYDHTRSNDFNRNENHYVNLPFYYNQGDKSSQEKTRWELIQTKLKQNITCVFKLEDVILSYNERFKHSWRFDTLYTFFDKHMKDAQRDKFFLETLPDIITMALNVELLFKKPIPILKQNKSMKITMTQEQAACLLANAFLCTFPHRRFNKKGAGLPDINFSNLYNDGGTDRKIEKLKCLIHYFERVTTKMPKGKLTFSRQYIGRESLFPNWEGSKCRLTHIEVIEDGAIEDVGNGMLQADFANKFVGGGVLGKGLVQEEIRFIICPEMIVSRLFTEVLGDQEVLIMTGCERFSNYSGYSDTFKFTGDYKDKTQRDSWGRRMVDVVAMDALVIRNPKEQFRSNHLNRELRKAYCAFNDEYRQNELIGNGKTSPVCTGNWGCGAFRGDKQLKAVIQMMAASQAGRDIYYCTFGDAEFSKDLEDLYKAIIEFKVEVRKMMQWISEYEAKNIKSSLFQYIFKQTGRVKS